VAAVAVVADGAAGGSSMVVSASNNGEVFLWDADGGQAVVPPVLLTSARAYAIAFCCVGRCCLVQ
jgi:hypothetical protein